MQKESKKCAKRKNLCKGTKPRKGTKNVQRKQTCAKSSKGTKMCKENEKSAKETKEQKIISQVWEYQ